MTLADATNSDLLAALGTDEIDGAFPAANRFDLARAAATELGLAGVLESRLALERGPAAQARERVECVAVEVPGEVCLVVGSAGGLGAYDAALEGLGRALHLAHVDPAAPFEMRVLADPGTRAMCGRILASLLIDRRWLTRTLSLSKSEAGTIARAAALTALYDLRRVCASVLYRTQWLAADLPHESARELYVTTMTEALGVAPPPADAVLDAPPSLSPGARLLALEGAGALVDELVQRFDVDWYRNPRAGPWLVQEVFAPARGERPEAVVTRATGGTPTLDRYIQRLESELTA
jgi:hypothetical protein